MLNLDQTLAEMTRRDAVGVATEEEGALLRSDENLEEWKIALHTLLSDMDAERNRLEARVARLRYRARSKEEFFDALAEFKEYQARRNTERPLIFRRMKEAKTLIRQYKARKHEEHQAKGPPPGEGKHNPNNKAKESVRRQQEHIERSQKERSRYRAAINEALAFFETEDYFKPEYAPVARTLASSLRTTLWPEKEEEEEKNSCNVKKFLI